MDRDARAVETREKKKKEQEAVIRPDRVENERTERQRRRRGRTRQRCGMVMAEAGFTSHERAFKKQQAPTHLHSNPTRLS